MTEDVRKLIEAIEDMAADVNREEIADHIKEDCLGMWCNAWSQAMKMALNRLKKELE